MLSKMIFVASKIFSNSFGFGSEGDRLQRLGDVAGVFAFHFGVDQIAGL